MPLSTEIFPLSPRGLAERGSFAERRAPSAPGRFADIVVVLITTLLLLSTIEAFGVQREAVAHPSAMDPLAIFKMAVRLIALLASVYLFRKTPGSVRALFSGPAVWFLAFFGVAALTSFVSVNPFVSASRAISFAIVIAFATAASAMYVYQGREAVMWKGLCFLLLATAVPLLGFALWIGPVVEPYDTFARLGGAFQSNHLGALAGIVLLTCVICLARRTLVVFSICMLPLALYVGVFTLSRGSWLATAVGMLVFLALVKRVRVWILPLAGLLVVSVMLGVQTGIVDPDGRLLTAMRRGQSQTELMSGTGRTGLYTYLLERQFPKRPLLGYGYQMLSVEDVAGDDTPQLTGIAKDLGWPAEQGHNLLISTLIGTGLIGLSVFLVALGTLLWRILTAARSGDPIGRDQVVLLAAILAHAMVDTTLVTGVDHAFVVLSAAVGLVSARGVLGHPYRATSAPAVPLALQQRWSYPTHSVRYR